MKNILIISLLFTIQFNMFSQDFSNLNERTFIVNFKSDDNVSYTQRGFAINRNTPTGNDVYVYTPASELFNFFKPSNGQKVNLSKLIDLLEIKVSTSKSSIMYSAQIVGYDTENNLLALSVNNPFLNLNKYCFSLPKINESQNNNYISSSISNFMSQGKKITEISKSISSFKVTKKRLLSFINKEKTKLLLVDTNYKAKVGEPIITQNDSNTIKAYFFNPKESKQNIAIKLSHKIKLKNINELYISDNNVEKMLDDYNQEYAKNIDFEDALNEYFKNGDNQSRVINSLNKGADELQLSSESALLYYYIKILQSIQDNTIDKTIYQKALASKNTKSENKYKLYNDLIKNSDNTVFPDIEELIELSKLSIQIKKHLSKNNTILAKAEGYLKEGKAEEALNTCNDNDIKYFETDENQQIILRNWRPGLINSIENQNKKIKDLKYNIKASIDFIELLNSANFIITSKICETGCDNAAKTINLAREKFAEIPYKNLYSDQLSDLQLKLKDCRESESICNIIKNINKFIKKDTPESWSMAENIFENKNLKAHENNFMEIRTISNDLLNYKLVKEKLQILRKYMNRKNNKHEWIDGYQAYEFCMNNKSSSLSQKRELDKFKPKIEKYKKFNSLENQIYNLIYSKKYNEAKLLTQQLSKYDQADFQSNNIKLLNSDIFTYSHNSKSGKAERMADKTLEALKLVNNKMSICDSLTLVEYKLDEILNKARSLRDYLLKGNNFVDVIKSRDCSKANSIVEELDSKNSSLDGSIQDIKLVFSQTELQSAICDKPQLLKLKNKVINLIAPELTDQNKNLEIYKTEVEACLNLDSIEINLIGRCEFAKADSALRVLETRLLIAQKDSLAKALTNYENLEKKIQQYNKLLDNDITWGADSRKELFKYHTQMPQQTLNESKKLLDEIENSPYRLSKNVQLYCMQTKIVDCKDQMLLKNAADSLCSDNYISTIDVIKMVNNKAKFKDYIDFLKKEYNNRLYIDDIEKIIALNRCPESKALIQKIRENTDSEMIISELNRLENLINNCSKTAKPSYYTAGNIFVSKYEASDGTKFSVRIEPDYLPISSESKYKNNSIICFESDGITIYGLSKSTSAITNFSYQEQSTQILCRHIYNVERRSYGALSTEMIYYTDTLTGMVKEIVEQEQLEDCNIYQKYLQAISDGKKNINLKSKVMVQMPSYTEYRNALNELTNAYLSLLNKTDTFKAGSFFPSPFIPKWVRKTRKFNKKYIKFALKEQYSFKKYYKKYNRLYNKKYMELAPDYQDYKLEVSIMSLSNKIKTALDKYFVEKKKLLK